MKNKDYICPNCKNILSTEGVDKYGSVVCRICTNKSNRVEWRLPYLRSIKFSNKINRKRGSKNALFVET
jgi:hypothetical protein